jgi:Tfp pilus assembly protein PilF
MKSIGHTWIWFLVLNAACATSPVAVVSTNSKLVNEFHDGNEAPVGMQPPRDISNEKTMIDPLYLASQADYHFTLAESYALEGFVDKAIEEFKLTLVYDPNSSSVHGRLATEYVRKGLLSEALEQAKMSVDLDPSSYDARVLIAGIYASLKVYDSAEKHYREAIAKFPDRKELKLHLGALLAEQKKYDDAAHIFRAAAEEQGNDQAHLAYYYLGRVWFEAKQNSKAEEAFKKAVRIKPNFEDGVIALSKLYEAIQKRPDALKLLESYQDKQGPSERVADVLGRYYLEDEDYTKAYRQFEIIETSDPSNLNIKVKMALVLIERKFYDKAAEKLKQILIQAPDSDKIRFYLGAVYEEMKDNNSAIEHFMKIPVSSTFYGEAILHAAYLYKVKGEVDRAVLIVETGMKESPDTEQFYTLYGSLLHEKKEYARAVSALENGAKKFPKNDQIWFFLGSLYDKVGKRKETLDSMEKVLDINPQHYQALNYLAYTWAETGNNLKQAEEYAKRALAVKAEDAYVQDTMGWVLFKQGRIAEAVKTLEVAHKIKPDESIIAEHLGDAYYRAEMPEKAKSMYRKAVELESDPETVRKINSKITLIEESKTPNRIPASAP